MAKHKKTYVREGLEAAWENAANRETEIYLRICAIWFEESQDKRRTLDERLKASREARGFLELVEKSKKSEILSRVMEMEDQLRAKIQEGHRPNLKLLK